MSLGIIRDRTIALQLQHYKPCDMDTSGATKYFGFMRNTGQFYILRMANSDSELRYYAADSGYTTAWTNRASHTYDLFGNVF